MQECSKTFSVKQDNVLSKRIAFNWCYAKIHLCTDRPYRNQAQPETGLSKAPLLLVAALWYQFFELGSQSYVDFSSKWYKKFIIFFMFAKKRNKGQEQLAWKFNLKQLPTTMTCSIATEYIWTEVGTWNWLRLGGGRPKNNRNELKRVE